MKGSTVNFKSRIAATAAALRKVAKLDGDRATARPPAVAAVAKPFRILVRVGDRFETREASAEEALAYANGERTWRRIR